MTHPSLRDRIVDAFKMARAAALASNWTDKVLELRQTEADFLAMLDAMNTSAAPSVVVER